jgi:hypothetical protein
MNARGASNVYKEMAQTARGSRNEDAWICVLLTMIAVGVGIGVSTVGGEAIGALAIFFAIMSGVHEANRIYFLDCARKFERMMRGM